MNEALVWIGVLAAQLLLSTYLRAGAKVVTK